VYFSILNVISIILYSSGISIISFFFFFFCAVRKVKWKVIGSKHAHHRVMDMWKPNLFTRFCSATVFPENYWNFVEFYVTIYCYYYYYYIVVMMIIIIYTYRSMTPPCRYTVHTFVSVRTICLPRLRSWQELHNWHA